ncbi:MAG: hypothetical protein LBU55_01555 [Elusimicrobiota bacterium]|jgi:regulator of replication initiation timing|nr:hypothetical protein [Elusimicrobiota bacterium]
MDIGDLENKVKKLVEKAKKVGLENKKLKLENDYLKAQNDKTKSIVQEYEFLKRNVKIAREKLERLMNRI